jgi:hypothetical protein
MRVGEHRRAREGGVVLAGDPLELVAEQLRLLAEHARDGGHAPCGAREDLLGAALGVRDQKLRAALGVALALLSGAHELARLFLRCAEDALDCSRRTVGGAVLSCGVHSLRLARCAGLLARPLSNNVHAAPLLTLSRTLVCRCAVLRRSRGEGKACALPHAQVQRSFIPGK